MMFSALLKVLQTLCLKSSAFHHIMTGTVTFLPQVLEQIRVDCPHPCYFLNIIPSKAKMAKCAEVHPLNEHYNKLQQMVLQSRVGGDFVPVIAPRFLTEGTFSRKALEQFNEITGQPGKLVKHLAICLLLLLYYNANRRRDGKNLKTMGLCLTRIKNKTSLSRSPSAQRSPLDGDGYENHFCAGLNPAPFPFLTNLCLYLLFLSAFSSTVGSLLNVNPLLT